MASSTDMASSVSLAKWEKDPYVGPSSCYKARTPRQAALGSNVRKTEGRVTGVE